MEGNELSNFLVQNQPTHVEWPVEEGAHYTLCMIGKLYKDFVDRFRMSFNIKHLDDRP